MDFSDTHNVFSVYAVYPQEDGEHHRRLIGRFVIYNDRVALLEDHIGWLSDMLPDGPVTPEIKRAIESLRHSAYTQVVNEEEVTQGKQIEGIPEEDWGQETPSTIPKAGAAPALVGQQEATPQPQMVQPDSEDGFKMQTPAPVFDYFRVGVPKAQVIEIHEGTVVMNGHTLSPDEVNRILYNLRSGLATLRYRAGSN
jgi:hypothetical protein